MKSTAYKKGGSSRLLAMLQVSACGTVLLSPLLITPLSAEEKLSTRIGIRGFADNNYRLDNDSDDIIGATTLVGFNYLSETTGSEFSASGDVGIGAYTGDDAGDLNGFNLPDLSLGYKVLGADQTLNFGLSGYVDTIDVRVDNNEDTSSDLSRSTGYEGRIRGNVGYSYYATELDILSINGGASYTDYFDDGGSRTPYTSGNLGFSWSRGLNRATRTGFSLNNNFYATKDDEKRRSITTSLTADGSHDVNERLSFEASLGPAYTYATEKRIGESGRDSDNRFSGSASFGLNYDILDQHFDLDVSHGVSPSSDGSAVMLTRVGANYRYFINKRSSVGLNANYSFRTDLDLDTAEDVDDRDRANLGANYRFEILDKVDASIGYRFGWENENQGDQYSHRVLFSLTREFNGFIR